MFVAFALLYDFATRKPLRVILTSTHVNAYNYCVVEQGNNPQGSNHTQVDLLDYPHTSGLTQPSIIMKYR